VRETKGEVGQVLKRGQKQHKEERRKRWREAGPRCPIVSAHPSNKTQGRSTLKFRCRVALEEELKYVIMRRPLA